MKLAFSLAAIAAISYPSHLPAQAASPSANLSVTVGPAVPEWGTYRHDPARTGIQPTASVLSDPNLVPSLAVKWQWPLPSLPSGIFKASPIVMNGVVYVGASNGFFYALDAKSGALLWQFPDSSSPAKWANGLTTSCSVSNYGIEAAAAFAHVNGENAVIFGAPDPDPATNGGFGSARLWALHADGANAGTLIWSSGVVAYVDGCTSGAIPPGMAFGSPPGERHERINYSAPLVAETFGAVYVGIASNDAPIQLGSVRAVDLNSGTLKSFKFNSVTDSEGNAQIGGGVWNGPATDGTAVYFTTGNTRTWESAPPNAYPSAPAVNYGLSLVSVDPATGSLAWNFQPVPYNADNDPDWNAGAAIMQTSCGQRIASVMKDGWSYALAQTAQTSTSPPTVTCAWQFPFTPGNLGPDRSTCASGPCCLFPATELITLHGFDGFRSPGAAWGNVFVVSTGGQALLTSGEAAGYGWLHALDVCNLQPDGSPNIRWMLHVPCSTGFANSNSLGAPTVSNGIIYVTTDQGHVVAFADPSVYPADFQGCSNVDFGVSNCQQPFYLVPVPHLLVDVELPDHSDAAYLRKEPVLAEGMVYVTTVATVYALAP
jgi:outer membrane protein assembly factor BamB